MKVLMDGRNHGAGTNTNKPCSTVVVSCGVKVCGSKGNSNICKILNKHNTCYGIFISFGN
ncbi:MAG: hypothetical protein E6053_01685 [Finegoldia magna]|uniref:hypothetical protein n=1 Tax=Finegoldia magna TaxID=1260 RepID=UPI002909687D|nr:hypothetical protein [Finegoldia magna]MDU5272990.1 hypothetical protein [Finegoldia magna]MDU5526167.1 hypothetical protein [Finegoldia magna]MDU5925121.1 hypothetical protein [Finegoldia magna]MDU7033025.1 hypothetical protein [Finegoldia magna]